MHASMHVYFLMGVGHCILFFLYVGAHFLEAVVKKFDKFHKSIDAQRDKCCYNSVLLIAYLYSYLVRL